MITIQAESVNDALIQGLRLILHSGERAESRNGPVLTVPSPVSTLTTRPEQRVLTCPVRGDNPFFHLVEALWMLDGRRDLAPLKPIVGQIAQYSDDGGKTQPGAYGYRWRKWFERDQLDWAVRRFRADPNDRRVVVSMWDGAKDPVSADAGSRDVPCNTHLYLLVRNGRLDMTVCCRSNDMLWGAHGANAVHFSVLQEYLASRIGVELGYMWQVSNNYHLYEATLTDDLIQASEGDSWCGYAGGLIQATPMFDQGQPEGSWDDDLEMWWEEPNMVGLRHSFFRRVATPVLMAHRAWQDKRDAQRFQVAAEVIEQCQAPDWRWACEAWLQRSRAKSLRASDDGPAQADFS